jgi:hypothetical protein
VSDLGDKQYAGKYELTFSSPVCIAYANCNLKVRGIKDNEFGQYFPDMHGTWRHLGSAINEGECTMAVTQRAGQAQSPVEMLTSHLEPDYWIQVLEIDAGKTISPITGEQSPMRHHRVHFLAFRKDCFASQEDTKINLELALPRSDFLWELDDEEEGEVYEEMPLVDQHNLVFNFHQAAKGAAYVASIAEPSEPGRGHHNFVTEVVDPSRGRCPPFTEMGGSVWIMCRLNGKASIRRMGPSEGARIYKLRGMKPDWLSPKRHAGFGVVGNSIPGNVADWLYCALLHVYSAVQGDEHHLWCDSE